FGIVVLLFIILNMILSLIFEIQGNRVEAVQEVYGSWAGEQVVAGPIITVEKTYTNLNKDGEKIVTEKYVHILPDNLEIVCELIPEIRYRGIYEVVLYKSKIRLTGNFPNFISEDENVGRLTSVEKYISFNISDLRGIEENVKLRINDKDLTVVPGLKNNVVFKNGFSSNLDFEGDTQAAFMVELNLRGSSSAEFIPLGKTTEVKMSSKWNNPSFSGSYLPNARKVSNNGFSADWKINHFNREYPQVWFNTNYEVFKSTFGVKLLMPVDEYQKTMRTSKYGVMIIILTFVSFFMIEIFSKKVIHPIQYLLVGLSLVIFYSLLLSISEYIVFKYSYLISSISIIVLIGFYIKSIYSSFKISIIIMTILTLFYGLMYIILQLQDYALLFGNISLFIVLAVIMFLTRKLNWFEVLSSKNQNQNNV
ncbi:MAG: cell envelope integrity protein CreD, partial [Ignavibacteriaceae bacterium]|nr:cell envelope integrity protein CreD [Ignavibacteriaceae bacterium]